MQAAKWLCHHQNGRNSGSRASSEHRESCRRVQAAWEDLAVRPSGPGENPWVKNDQLDIYQQKSEGI